jgi:3',5'-cyclic AMP phosphodiesterase CpdA
MARSLRVAVTADLHWGHHVRGMAAVRLLFEHVKQHPPDLLILAGDIGTGSLYGDCLAQLAGVPCLKAALPGNHDVWVEPEADHDSLHLYETELPRVSAQHGFHYLDQAPLILPEADVAMVGTMNWYDYSWALEALRKNYPDELHRLQSKYFTRGRHNDANFVRWPLDDVSFTARAVAAFEKHLLSALEQVGRVIVVTHHPPIYDLGFPRLGPPTSLDSLLWDAFCGNRSLEDLLERHSQRIAFAFCGHTHRARQTEWHGIRGYNVGGDYHFKRMLCLDWPAGTVEEHQFGEES